jgi:phage tail sheath gpL-like
MTISHTIPSTTRQPGEFHEFDLLSGAQGLAILPNRILLIGEMLAGGTATADAFEQIFDELQADGLFGEGSLAALMCRKALEVGRRLGTQPEIYATGVADPGGTAAQQTITVSAGTAAAAGDIVFRIAGRTLRAGVSAGDDQDAVASAIKDAIDADLAILPITAAVVTNVVTTTFNTTGVNGNDLLITVDDVGLTGLTVTPAVSVAGVGVAVVTTALSNSLSKWFEVVVLSNHATADVTSLDTHLDAAWAAAAKRWVFGMLGENGTLSAANTLSAAGNDERMSVISYEDSPSLPGEIVAAVACAVSARAQPNYNWDFDELPLFPPVDASVYTATEIESALAAGTTPLQPNDARDASQIVRLITTKTTEGGNPFENTKDLATMRGLVFTTRQLDAVFSQQFRGQLKSEQILKRMRSVAYNTLKLLEDLLVTQNVDDLFPQLLVETDAIVATRAVINVPESIIPNLHQIVFKHVLFVE